MSNNEGNFKLFTITYHKHLEDLVSPLCCKVMPVFYLTQALSMCILLSLCKCLFSLSSSFNKNNHWQVSILYNFFFVIDVPTKLAQVFVLGKLFLNCLSLVHTPHWLAPRHHHKR